MKNFNVLFAALIASASGVLHAEKPGEYSQEVKINAEKDGSFKGESVVKEVDVDGTVRTARTEQQRHIQSNGQVKEVLKDSLETNPKGMLNEKTINREVERTAKPDGSAKVNIKENIIDKDGAKIERAASAHKVVKANGNTETKVTGVEERDPKGLFNKSHVAVTETIETRPDGSIVK